MTLENGGLPHKIARAQFMTLSGPEQMGVLFDVLMESRRQALEFCRRCEERQTECQKRFDKLEARKWFDKGTALIGGVIGGIAGALGMGK